MPPAHALLTRAPNGLGWVQILYFVQTFAEVLEPEDAFTNLQLRALDAAMADGDHALVHRLHVAVLLFVARSAGEAERGGDGGDDASTGLKRADFLALPAALREELHRGVRLHAAWPELARRVAGELLYDDRVTLRLLRHSDYPQLPLGSRVMLLAALCDAASSTLAARKYVDARVARLEATAWDWDAVCAGEQRGESCPAGAGSEREAPLL